MLRTYCEFMRVTGIGKYGQEINALLQRQQIHGGGILAVRERQNGFVIRTPIASSGPSCCRPPSNSRRKVERFRQLGFNRGNFGNLMVDRISHAVGKPA